MQHKIKVEQGVDSEGGMLLLWKCPLCGEGNLGNNPRRGIKCAFCEKKFKTLEIHMKDSLLVSNTDLLKKLCDTALPEITNIREKKIVRCDVISCRFYQIEICKDALSNCRMYDGYAITRGDCRGFVPVI